MWELSICVLFNVCTRVQQYDIWFILLATFFFPSPSTFSSLDLCFTIWQMNFYLTLLQSLMRQSKPEWSKLSGP